MDIVLDGKEWTPILSFIQTVSKYYLHDLGISNYATQNYLRQGTVYRHNEIDRMNIELSQYMILCNN